MRIMECIGNVTLSKAAEFLDGASWKIVVPLTHAGINGDVAGRTEPIIIFDELGAGNGSLLAVSESAEAAAPFHPNTKPIDGYNAAILDSINV